MKPGHTHTHTHSYAYMHEHTEYVLYTGASMHEPVAAHTLTNIVELIAHTRLSFMGSNTIADMQQTVLTVQYDGCSMCLHVHKMFYYMQKIELSNALCSTSVCKIKLLYATVSTSYEKSQIHNNPSAGNSSGETMSMRD